MGDTEFHEDGFSVTTVFNASPSRLYRAWTEKADLEMWLATSAEVDARVNGKYELKFTMADGELSARGEYLELEPGRKIVQTWESWGPEGRFTDGNATVEVQFNPIDDNRTAMTQTERSEHYRDKDRARMSLGGTMQAHEALARFLEHG